MIVEQNFAPCCAWGFGRSLRDALRLDFDDQWSGAFNLLMDAAHRFALKNSNRRAMRLIDHAQFFCTVERDWEIFDLTPTYALDRSAAALVMGARRVERDGGRTLLRAAARLKEKRRRKPNASPRDAQRPADTSLGSSGPTHSTKPGCVNKGAHAATCGVFRKSSAIVSASVPTKIGLGAPL